MDGTVLIADDDRTIRTVLTQAFGRAGCKVHATASLTTLMRWIDEGRGDLVISDVVMPDGNGLETLPKIYQMRPDLPVIVISAQNTIMTAIKATEASAYDYLPKPFDLPDLMKRSARALAQSRRAPRTAASGQDDAEQLPLIGRTPAMQQLYRLIARVLNTDMPVLIFGESGTGKSLIAEVIHRYGDRRGMPFRIVGATEMEDLGQLPEILDAARGGTVLFDEIGDMSAPAQARLVRAIDALDNHGPRILAATQQDLAAAVEVSHFRRDLYYRLSAVFLQVPPLRARIDDIPLLAEYFLAALDPETGAGKRFAPEALAEMRAHVWPGNIRELANTIRRIALTCPEQEITLSDVVTALGPLAKKQRTRLTDSGEKLGDSIAMHLRRYFDLHGDALPPDGLYARILHEMEHPLLQIALEATGGNQAKCAALLGINRNTLRKKITDLDIQVTRRRKMM